MGVKKRAGGVGTRVRKVRERNRISLRALATAAGVSPGYLSGFERDQYSARIETLRRIAQALNVPFVELFADDEDEELEAIVPNGPKLNGRGKHDPPNGGRDLTVIRRGSRKKLISGEGQLYELLTPDLAGAIEFLWIEVPPGTTPIEPMAHLQHGEECALVIAGTMDLQIGDEHVLLEAGDAVRFDPGIPHRVANVGDDVLIHVTASTPPSF